MVKVRWSKKAIKQLASIDTRYRSTIEEKANSLTAFPQVQLDIKKLEAADNQYRMRVGDYRVIFQIDDGEPVICTIQAVKRRTSTTY
ncbi:type II toxin-antitoxin system RelE/ParE family toxin [Acerihabitans sp. KWT182]|uniref:Type II toxin-antitoxin system RelE/ParE family toxin n=1 Tax=Acerihabitans sp. KWT182 TaxID=3157919 RepID=A0AAU7QE40_9GAMM